MKDRTESLIARMPDHDLSKRELQETRHSNLKIIDEMVDSADLQEWGRKIDRLWLYLGWIPATLESWKALSIAGIVAFFIGGQPLIERLAKFLEGYLP